jgi:ABC-type branched-subunit amino acid transport system substrate-binding protein
LLITACGNTASRRAKSVSGTEAEGAAAAGPVGGSDATVDTESRPEPKTADTQAAQARVAAEEVAPGAGGKTSAGIRKIRGSGKGYTDTTINVGFQLVVDTEAGFKAVGAGAVAPDETAIANTMIDWINKHGGIAGRKVRPIFHTTEILNGTWASQAEATCRTFTEDNKVVAAITSATGGSDALWACTSRKGTALVERNMWLWADKYYEQRPDMLYTPARMSPDRWIGHWLTGLKKTGFFKGKLGVARFDGEPFDTLTRTRLKPALKKLGVTITHEAVLTTPPSIAAFGNMNGEISNAIVQMRTKQVDHVIFLQNAGSLPFFWLPEADAQKWYPQYGLSTADIPLTLTGLSPQTQLENAQGVSWTPPLDVPLQNDDPQRAKREKVCYEIYKNNPGFHNGTMCDAMLFLKFALDRATAISPDGLAAAVRRIGDTYQSPMTAFSFMNGSQYYDGAAGVRYFDWKTKCAVQDGEEYGCFKFTTGSIAARR